MALGTEEAEVVAALGSLPGGSAARDVRRLGGLTNRTYSAEIGEGRVVVRLPGAGTAAYIDRDAEAVNARIAAELGIAPHVLMADGGVLVTRFVAGPILTPEQVRCDGAVRGRVAGLLRRLHDSGAPLASAFDPQATIRAHRARVSSVPDGTDRLIELIERAVTSSPPGWPLVPCHNDPWPENFIDTGDRLVLIDWEYAGLGDPAWDLADLAVECELDESGAHGLLVAYAGGQPPPELSARVAELRPVTDLLWGLWALVQHRDGNRAMDYDAYGRRRLARAADTLR